jgi:hypothetical protein
MARFGLEVHAAKNGDRVILCAYRAFSLELLTHDRGDFARLVMSGGFNVTGPLCISCWISVVSTKLT